MPGAEARKDVATPAAPTPTGPLDNAPPPTAGVDYKGPGGGSPEAAHDAFGHYADDDGLAAAKKLHEETMANVAKINDAVAEAKAAELAKLIASTSNPDDDFSIFNNDGKKPTADSLDQELFEAKMAALPPEMRALVVDKMGKLEGDAALNEHALRNAQETTKEITENEERKKKYEENVAKKIETGAGEFAALAGAKPKLPPDASPGEVEDAQKQYDKQVQAALAKIPYRERERALEAMSPEARALAETAIATKKAEMNAKAVQLANAINAGMLENGTDTTTIFQTLATLTPDERRELEDEYGKTYLDKDGEPRDLEADLRKEFKDEKNVFGQTTRSYKLDRQFLDAVFSGDTAEQKAIALQLGARGSSLTDCTDEPLIMKTLESIKDPAEREETFRIFKERQEKAGEDETDVSQMLRAEMVTGDVDEDDYEYKRALALSHGQFDEAKAVQVAEHMDPGFLGDVSIRDASTVAAFVPGGALITGGVALADAAGVIDAEKKVAEPDTEKAAEVYSTASSQTERDKISAHFAEANDGKSVREIAEERCPDKADALLVDSAAKNDRDGMAAARWKKAEDKLNSDEQGMMKQIEGDRHKQVIARIDAEFGEGTFETKSKNVMNEDELVANAELAEAGKVKPITGLLATTPQVSTGWTLDDIAKHLKDPNDPKKQKLLSKEEMEALKAELCEQRGMTAEEFDEMIDLKLGGKDAFKLRQMLKGEPANQAERMQRIEEEQAFNREGLANLPGKLLTDSFSTMGESQDAQYKKLQEANAAITDLEKKQADGSISPEEQAELAKLDKDFTERTGYFDTNVKGYQLSRDTISNDVTTVLAATAGAVATVMTGGAAGPVVGALIAGLTTIASKTALLGDTYNDRDRMKDELQTLLSVGAAGATAALGPTIDLIANRLGGAAGAMLKGPAGEILKELVAAGTKGTLAGGVGGFINSTGGALLDEKTLQGKGEVGDIITKSLTGTLSSAAAGGGSSVISKGLDLGGLQSADPTKQFTAGGHAVNKALSTVGGDAIGFAVDPANMKGDDVLGKFLKKEIMGIPGSVIGAFGDYRAATQAREADAAALGIPPAEIDKPENQLRIAEYQKVKQAGFMGDVPLTEEERAYKAQQDEQLKALTKPSDDEFPIYLEADDVDPRKQRPDDDVDVAKAPPPKPTGERTRTGSLPDLEEDRPDPRSPLEQLADLGLLPESMTKQRVVQVEEAADSPARAKDPNDPILDRVNREADENAVTRLREDAEDRGLDPETARLAAKLADGGPLPLDEAIAEATKQRDAGASLPPGTRDLLEIVKMIPMVGEKFHPERNVARDTSDVLTDGEQGSVTSYTGDQTLTKRHERPDHTTATPKIQVATGDRVIMTVPDAADPTIMSTDFSHCGATIIRGVGKDGKPVLLVGHVMESDPVAHSERLVADVDALREQGVTNLQVVVMPGLGDELPAGPNGQQQWEERLPGSEELQTDLGDGVEVTRISRPSGPGEHAHVVVTKHGVTVYAGELDPKNPPAVLAEHEFDA